MDKQRRECTSLREKNSWTLRRLADLVLRAVRLCSVFRSDAGTRRESRTEPGTELSRTRGSRHCPHSLLQLAQPESWLQFNRDIQQRLQSTRSHHQLQRSPADEDTVESISAKPVRHSSAEQQNLPESVRDTLSNPPWTRTHGKLEEAVRELKMCTDFSDYPQPLQYSLCKVGWYLRLGHGRVIFREHSPAECFYFIISGNGLHRIVNCVYNIFYVVVATSEQEPAQTLTAGASFGDQSIIEQTGRTMTCSADGQVELFVISKSDFLDLSLRQARISYQKTKHFAFCKSVSVMRHWPIHLLEVHPDQCKVAQFVSNTIVVKDSRKNPWVYIIMSGSCRVVKRFVYGCEEQSLVKGKRKSFTNPSEISKLALAGESAASRQLPAVENLMQRQQVLSPLKKNKHPQGSTPEQVPKNGRRLPHTVSTPQMSSESRQVHQPRAQRKQFLVQLQQLQPKDTFGLSSFVHQDEPSVTLVSNGAEVVMVSKEFLLKHFSDTIRDKLNRQITKLPSQEAMLKRIREHYLRNTCKQTTISNSKRKVL